MLFFRYVVLFLNILVAASVPLRVNGLDKRHTEIELGRIYLIFSDHVPGFGPKKPGGPGGVKMPVVVLEHAEQNGHYHVLGLNMALASAPPPSDVGVCASNYFGDASKSKLECTNDKGELIRYYIRLAGSHVVDGQFLEKAEGFPSNAITPTQLGQLKDLIPTHHIVVSYTWLHILLHCASSAWQ